MLKRLSLLLAAGLLLLLAACGANEPVEPSVQQLTFTDAMGREVSVQEKPLTIVALQGSYAQLWLAAGGTLSGATDDFFANYPEQAEEKTTSVGSLKEPSLEGLLDLQPDFVILSPDITAQVKLDEPLTQANIPHGYFKQESYTDYLDMLKIFTDITGEGGIYKEAEQRLTHQISTLLETVPKESPAPKVLLVRGMSSGVQVLDNTHSAGRVLQDLNGQNIADSYPSLLKEISPELVLDENPDVILVVPMGEVEAANASFWRMVQASPLWQRVNAIKNDQVHLLPKELFQLKPNARWGESYEYLARILYQIP